MSNPYTQENAAERERVAALVNRLTDEELSRPVEAGWTVAGCLAHLAFWDRRALTLLRKWQQEGIGPFADRYGRRQRGDAGALHGHTTACCRADGRRLRRRD